MALREVEMSDAVELAVVGTSFCQDALHALVRAHGLDPADEVRLKGLVARLVRDPDNAYDANAVRVEVDGHHVGHLPREVAANYAPLLDEFVAHDAVAVGTADVLGAPGVARDNIGVRVTASTPSGLRALLRGLTRSR